MRNRSTRLLIGLTTIVLMILGCNVPSTEPPSLTIAATPTITLTPLPFPVVSAPGILSFHMVDVNNGWAFSQANVLRTADGGAIWYDVTPAGFTGVSFAPTAFFLNASTGWFVLPASSSDFSSGSLYRTMDGGLTWETVAVPFVDGRLQFLDPADGWVLTSLGAGAGSEAMALFHTIDSGSSWMRVYVNDPTVPGSGNSLPLGGMKDGIAFLDASTGWVTGAEPISDFVYLYKTADGGRTWTHQEVSLPSGFSGAETAASAPVFFGGIEGVLPVGLFTTTPGEVFYLSHDGGTTWTPGQPVTDFGKVSIASRFDFFVWNGGPTLYASHDAGVTWSTVSPNISVADTLMTIQFVDAATGWALTGDASYHYSFYKTTDGGATWMTLVP